MGTSKQDRQGVRTATDIEYRYNFGKSFAEVYNLVRDCQTAIEDAAKAIEGLDSEEIFNRLTNYGEVQGIYRDANGQIYVNASYIQSGTLAAEYIDADNLKVKAANITGTLTASQINTTSLKVSAANITGTLSADQIDTTYLQVDAANITGTLSVVNIDDFEAEVTVITNDMISTADISADQITTGTLDAAALDLSGLMALTDDGSTQGYMGARSSGGVFFGSKNLNVGFIATNSIAEMTYYGNHSIWVNSGGCYADSELLTSSDRQLKNSISYDLSAAEELFMQLKPCSFAYNKDSNSKTHWGFIAQDFIEAATAAGLDSETLAALGSYEGMYSLGYGSFAALNVHMIQKIIKALAANGISLEG